VVVIEFERERERESDKSSKKKMKEAGEQIALLFPPNNVKRE